MTAGKRSQKSSKQRGNINNISGSSNSTFSTSTFGNNQNNRFLGKNHTGGRRISDSVSPSCSNILLKHSNSYFEFDKSHNRSVPCCIFLKEIVQKIFPDCHHFITAGRGTNEIAIDSHCSFSGVTIHPQHAFETQDGSKLPPSNHRMSLLNLLVRQYLLEDWRERRHKKMSSLKIEMDSCENAADPKGYTQHGDNHEHEDDDHDLDHDDFALDQFLDSFLSVPNTNGCQDTISNSDELKTADFPVPPNRTVESFVEYVGKSIEVVAVISSNEQATGHRKRASRSKGKTNVVQNSSLSSSCMPPIPLSEVTSLIERVTCRYCKGECNDYLKNIGSFKFNSCSRANNYTRAMGREKGVFAIAMGTEEDEDGGKEKDMKEEEEEEKPSTIITQNQTNDATNNVKIITSIQLNKCSIQGDMRRHQISCDGFHWDRNDVDYAFDYSLLEEGGVTVEEDHFSKEGEEVTRGIWLDLVQDRNNSNKFFQLKQSTGGKSNLVLTVEDFKSWIKDVIVPCGMVEAWPFGVSEEDIQLLSSRVDSSLTGFIQFLEHEMSRVLRDAHKALADAEESLKTPGAFNVKAGKALKECDGHQNTFMCNCRKLLVDLDRLTAQSRRHRHPYQKWSSDIMDELWDCYTNCSFSLIDPSMRFMWEGIQLDVNRTGSVPLHFNSPQQRENLKEILKKRLVVISRLQEDIEGKLSARLEGGDETSMNLRRLIVLGHFFALHREENIEPNKTETAIHRMLENRDKLIFEVIYFTSVNKILHVQDTRCNKLFDEISRTYTMVCDAMKNIMTCRKDSLTWQANSIIIEENEIEFDMLQTQNSEPSLDKDLHRVKVLCEFTKNVLNQYRFLQQLEVSDVKDMTKIPREVVNMCLGLSPSQGCQGGFGKRRVVGILSSFVYSWLEDKCVEWHADLSHQELMTETENELLRVQKDSIGQKKKSKKKKKRKSAKNISSGEMNDEPTYSKQGDLTPDEVPTSPSSTLSSYKTDLVFESCTERYSRPNEGSITEGKDIENMEHIILQTSTVMSDVARVNSSTSSSEAMHMSNKQDNLQVFVSDQGNLVSVENFLCSRYFRVLKENNAEQNDEN